MSNIDILKVCEQLSQKGKTPTVALVKTRIPRDTPLAQIIDAIMMHKSNSKPEAGTTDHVNPKDYEEEALPSTLEACGKRIVALEVHNKQLQSTITELQAEVAALTARRN